MADATSTIGRAYEVERKWRGRRAIVEILAQRMVLNLNVAADTPIRLQLAELDEYRFLAPDQATGLFPAWAVGRLAAAVAARRTGTTVYLPMLTTG